MAESYFIHRSLLVISFLGLLVSGYLLITYVSPTPLVCGIGGGCDIVQASEYAYIFGLPTPLYGVVYYFTLGMAAALWKYFQKPISWFLLLLTGTGLSVSVWLTYLEAFVINAWCFWCVISAILATTAFILVWIIPSLGIKMLR